MSINTREASEMLDRYDDIRQQIIQLIYTDKNVPQELQDQLVAVRVDLINTLSNWEKAA